MITRSVMLLAVLATQFLHGGIVFEGTIPSTILNTQRMIRVSLPATYHDSSEKRYPVLYIHDGQNAFSTAGPHAAFGWGSWELDKTAIQLAASGKMHEVILVAVDCSPRRYQEYRGPASVKNEDSEYKGYRDFLVKELKPYVDKKYRTLPAPEHTGVLGSSMGGVCALALAWEHPEVFGLTASISGAFQVEEEAFLKILREHRGPKKPFRVYLDSGTVDHSGGDDNASKTKLAVAELKRLGWTEPGDLLHFIDPVLSLGELGKLNLARHKLAEALKSQHNELYWRLRVWRALEFMFPPQP